MRTLVIATRNAHKTDEIRSVLGPAFECLCLRDFPDAPEPEETGTTFAANARLKAHSLAAWLLANPPPQHAPIEWVLADDSGLEVDALDGAPGVQSARFAAAEFDLPGNAPDAANNAKLLRLLASVPAVDRTGRFRCALALTQVEPGLNTLDFDGACEGRLGLLPRGAQGFGYDPLFFPEGYEATFAELGEDVKNRISHRSCALAALRDWFSTYPG